MTESVKRCRRSANVKEIVKAPVIAICTRNFLKENSLMTVKNVFIIADASNITKYKRTFIELKFISNRNKCKILFSYGNKNRPFILKVVSFFF